MTPRLRPSIAFAFFVSGASALVYQVAWQRILALHTGVGIESIAVIVGAFMAGLGLGSLVGGKWSRSLSRSGALVGFVLLEGAVALFGVGSVPRNHDGLASVHGSGLLAFPGRAGVVHFVSLLPPTVLMGMSLPLLVRAMVADARSASRTIGLLYGINGLGASLGALATPWVLVRHLGLSGAVLVAAGGNVLAALSAAMLLRGGEARDGPDFPEAAAAPAATGLLAGPGLPLAPWLALSALSGFAALSLEILWFRILDVATRSTAFTFGTLLSGYLLGSAVGCLVGARRAAGWARPLRVFLFCQCFLLAYAGAAVLVLVALPSATPVLAAYYEYWRGGGVFPLGRSWNVRPLLALYGLLPAALYGLPTVLMGLSFPALQRAVQDDPRTSGHKVGLVQGANIAGCVAGSLGIGLVGLEWSGTTGSLRLLMGVGVAFAAVGVRAFGRRSVFAPVLVGLAALAVLLPGTDRLWRRLHGTESALALTGEDATGVAAILPWERTWRVAVNGKQHSWIPFGGVHTSLGAIPALVHPAPVDVAIIGLGSGDTAWASACRPVTRSLTVFELSGRQEHLLSRLDRREVIPELAAFLRDPRLAIRTADGRHALAREGKRYDVIEADALWPYAAYSGHLYSVEFFSECAASLKPGGLMCTWVPTPRVAAAFRAAFPHVAGTERPLLLLGSNDPIVLDPDAWVGRLRDPAVGSYLGRERVDEVRSLIVSVGAAPASLPAGEMNRDLFPRDEFLTP